VLAASGRNFFHDGRGGEAGVRSYCKKIRVESERSGRCISESQEQEGRREKRVPACRKSEIVIGSFTGTGEEVARSCRPLPQTSRELSHRGGGILRRKVGSKREGVKDRRRRSQSGGWMSG